MANPFDQFDGAQAPQAVAPNPFDAFDNQVVAEAPTENRVLAGKVKAAAPDLSKVPDGRAAAIEDTSMRDRLRNRMSPERQLPEEALQRVEAARVQAIQDAPKPTLLVRLKENIKSGWSNSTIGSLLESIQEPIANEPLELRRMRATVDGLAREKARRSGALGDVLSDPSLVELPDKALDSEIEKQGKRLVSQIEKSAPETKARINDREKALTETAKRVGSYQGLPDYQGPVEGLASLTGQILGSLPDPANFVGGPEVGIAKNTSRLGRVANKFIGEGIGAAAGNLAVEPMSQANRIRTGELDQFSPADAAKGAALGFIAGGVLGAAPEVIKRKGPSLVSQMDGATHGTPTTANVAANEIAMKPIEPVAAPSPAELNANDTNASKLVEKEANPEAKTPVAPTDSAFDQAKVVEKMTPDEFNKYQIENNITGEAQKVGNSAKTPEDIAYLAEQGKLANAEAKRLVAAKDFDALEKVMTKEQFFNEAHQAATKSSEFATDIPSIIADFDKEWKDQGGQGGSENQVIFKDGQVIKRNYNGKLGQALVNYGGDINKFNKSVELHNELFPSTKMDIIGESATSDGPAPVVSQPEIKGKPATQKEIIDFMRKKGFEPDGGPNYLNKELGIRVEDLRTANVLKDAKGELHVIDSVIKEVAPKPSEIAAPSPVSAALQPASKVFALPEGLAKSNPRYSFGSNNFEVKFDSDLDKALYILAGEKKSAADSRFLKIVQDATGMTEAEARQAGRTVRDELKMMAREGSDGDVLTVPEINSPELKSTQENNAIPKQSPESVPVSSQAKAGEGVGQEVRSGVSESPGTRQDPLFPKEKTVANDTSAAEQPPKVLQELVSPKDLQLVADDLDVHQILSDIEDSAPPAERSAPIAEAVTRFLTGATKQETAPRVGGRPPMPPIGNNGNAPQDAGGQPYKPGLTSLPLGLGKIAEAAKIIAGTIEGNIRDASKKVFGVLRNYEYAKSKLSQQFQQATLPASRLARKILTKEGNDIVGNLLMSGKIDEAKALVAKETRYGKEFSAAIDAVRKALDYSYRVSSEAREGAVNYIKDYFPRQMIDYSEFRKFLGKDEQSVADKAIKRAQDASKTPLTPEQVEAVVADLISQSRRGGGKPGFLKPRTIAEIDSNISKFYEPWDVALENHLNKVTNDVVDRAYLGKFDPTQGALWDPANGHFGKVIAEEVASGRLSPKAANIVIDNLQDRFKLQGNVSEISKDIGRKIRFAQSAAYLGQLQTAVAQFGDVFGSILHNGIIDTAKGYGNRRIDLADIGIHEGNVETAQFSRRKGLVDKAADITIKFGVGLSDQFNKGGVANAIARHYADVVKNPMSDAFRHLNRDYSAKFPDQWPKILKELQSRAFAEGKIKDLPNAQFFLYNEMSDIHPINPSGMAQGFNAAHPLAKPFWGLKSYMIKQLDIMRARGYERIKDPATRGEGLAYLAAYAAVVAAGQNFAVSWLRDKLADRQTDTSDYFIGGFLQPLGLSRYTITQMKQGEYGKAAAEMALPIFSLGREATNDVSLVRDLVAGRRDKKTQLRTVKDVGDLLSQSELVKHFPVVGSLFYSRAGKGAANEQKRKDRAAKGREQPNTFDTFRTIVAPDETARN